MIRPAALVALAVLSACDTSTGPPVVTVEDPLLVGLCSTSTTAPPTLSSASVVAPIALDLTGHVPPRVHFDELAGRYELTAAHDGEPNDLEYVSGGSVATELVTDHCAYVAQVKLGSQVLTTTPTNGAWIETGSTIAADGSKHSMVTLNFPATGDGGTDLVQLTVGQSGSSATTGYQFRLVRAAEVRPIISDRSDPDGSVRVGISQAELANAFRQALYDEFNGAADEAFSQDTRLYALGHDIGLNVDRVGAHIDFSFSVDTFCQPRFDVHGTFNIDTNRTSGIVFTWPEPITATPTYSFACKLVDLVPLAGQLAQWGQYELIEKPTQDGVRGDIEQKLRQMAPATSPIVQGLLNGGGSVDGELYINLQDSLGPQIHIDVPYVSPLERARKPTGLPKTLSRMLLAHGIGLTGFQSGPNGLPNTTPAFPVLNALFRYPVSSLPSMLATPAQLIAVSGYDHFTYTPGCQLPLATTSAVFAVNDTAAGAAQLRATGTTRSYRAVLILGGAVGLTPSCQDYNTQPIIALP